MDAASARVVGIVLQRQLVHCDVICLASQHRQFVFRHEQNPDWSIDSEPGIVPSYKRGKSHTVAQKHIEEKYISSLRVSCHIWTFSDPKMRNKLRVLVMLAFDLLLSEV